MAGFVDYGALKYFTESLKERKAPAHVSVHVHGSSDGQAYVSLGHRVAPDSRMTPSDSVWESATTLLQALLSPQGSIQEAKLYEFTGIKGVEITGYISADEINRINQEQIARFREETLLKQS